MRRELFVGLDVGLYPRHSFAAGEIVLPDGVITDRLLIVLEGRLSGAGIGKALGPGDVAKPVEFFGASRYSGALYGRGTGRVAIVPRPAVRACFDAQGLMMWNLVCATAIEALAAAKEPV